MHTFTNNKNQNAYIYIIYNQYMHIIKKSICFIFRGWLKKKKKFIF